MDFSALIINWYNLNKRDLPWRNTTDPYKIWLSEVILQQTRVDQGLPYYYRFIDEFPEVSDLAKANQEKVMKIWQGLGYYSRARNLHQTAQIVHEQFNDEFPTDYKTILSLKGIGSYTAAAIASFAFNKCHAVVDGNVYRVLSRFFGVHSPIDSVKGKKEFSELAELLIDKNNPAQYNQAIMEFGALQCVPKNPDCQVCPLIQNCVAFHNNSIDLLPVKSNKIKQKERYFNYLIIHKKNQTLIRKRIENDIWQNLFDFPLIETSNRVNAQDLFLNKEWVTFFENQQIVVSHVSEEYKHVLSHQKIFARFYHVQTLDFPSHTLTDCLIIPKDKLQDYAVPKLIDNYLKRV